MKYLPGKTDDLSNYWAADIEANGLDDADTIWCMCLQNIDSEEEVSLVGHDAITKWIDEHPDVFFVGHNFLSYDARTLRRILDVGISDDHIVDTLVLSYLYHPHLPGGHALGDWGQRLNYGKGDFHEWHRYSAEMLAYCQQDVRLTRRVFLALRQRMAARGFSEMSCWIEHKIRLVIDKQERRGFCFDVEGAKTLYNRLRGLEETLEGPILKLFPPELVPVATYEYRLKKDGCPTHHYERHLSQYPKLEHSLDGTYTVFDYKDFNIGSPKQRVERLLSLGWEPTKFTPTGQPKVDEDSLVSFANECGRPEVQAIADWLVANGRANMVNTWLNAVRADGKIHGRVFSCGALTRRMRHNTPNTANIPGNEATFGKECRSLWTATPGRVLVGYDASALEMRMFGHYLGNKEAADLYIYGDPHTANADALTKATGVTFERKPVKTDFYAFLYGASNSKLGSHYGKSAKFGKQIRETLLNNTPGLAALAKRIEKEAESGWIRTIDGGFVRSLSTHAALNSKLQSAGAIAMKVCSIFLDEEIAKRGWDVWKVGDIHDEGQLDCPEDIAEEVGQLAVECLRRAGEFLNLSVPLDGEYKIGKTWAETH